MYTLDLIVLFSIWIKTIMILLFWCYITCCSFVDFSRILWGICTGTRSGMQCFTVVNTSYLNWKIIIMLKTNKQTFYDLKAAIKSTVGELSDFAWGSFSSSSSSSSYSYSYSMSLTSLCCWTKGSLTISFWIYEG